MSSGFFRLKLKGEELSFDSKIGAYVGIDKHFSELGRAVLEGGVFTMSLTSGAEMCVPINNIEYLIFIPEEYVKEENNVV